VTSIARAAPRDVEAIAPLFDAYRDFYLQPRDLEAARAFLAERLARDEAVVFVARESDVAGAAALGFTLLYPTFSSVSLAPIFVLNDLYVREDARRSGVGCALLLRAEAHARESGAKRLVLRTARDNLRAQRVYESLGWARDEVFFTYQREL
jgi:ribosomal protein S18 acetylase RimI-like enzyme